MEKLAETIQNIKQDVKLHGIIVGTMDPCKRGIVSDEDVQTMKCWMNEHNLRPADFVMSVILAYNPYDPSNKWNSLNEEAFISKFSDVIDSEEADRLIAYVMKCKEQFGERGFRLDFVINALDMNFDGKLVSVNQVFEAIVSGMLLNFDTAFIIDRFWEKFCKKPGFNQTEGIKVLWEYDYTGGSEFWEAFKFQNDLFLKCKGLEFLHDLAVKELKDADSFVFESYEMVEKTGMLSLTEIKQAAKELYEPWMDDEVDLEGLVKLAHMP